MEDRIRDHVGTVPSASALMSFDKDEYRDGTGKLAMKNDSASEFRLSCRYMARRGQAVLWMTFSCWKAPDHES